MAAAAFCSAAYVGAAPPRLFSLSLRSEKVCRAGPLAGRGRAVTTGHRLPYMPAEECHRTLLK